MLGAQSEAVNMPRVPRCALCIPRGYGRKGRWRATESIIAGAQALC